MAARESRNAPRISLIPRSIRGRVLFAFVVTTLLVAGIAALMLAAFWRAQVPASDERLARGTVAVLTDALAQETHAVARATELYARSEYSYAQSTAGTDLDPKAADRFERHMEDVDAAIWIHSDGSLLHSLGDSRDIGVLLGLASGEPEAASGLLALPEDRLASVALHPIVGTPEQVGAGSIAAARVFDPGSTPALPGFEFSATPFETERDQAVATLRTEGVHSSFYPNAGDIVIDTEITGIDGRSVGWARVQAPSPLRGQLAGLFSLALLVAIGTASIAGLASGLVLTRSVSRPLESLAARIQRDGHAAIEGRDLTRPSPDPSHPDEIRSVVEVFAQLLDHLARRQAELLDAELTAEASARNLSLAVNDSPEAKLLVQDEVITVANPAAESLLGIAAGTLEGAPISVLIDLSLTNEAGIAVDGAALIRSAQEHPVQVCIERKDGSARWAEIRAIEHEVDFRTFVVTARDITEERRAQEMRAEVISLVSHDLRAPLSVISGYLELLDRPLDQERRSAASTSALRSVQRMEALIDDILSATRAEELFAPASLMPVEMSTLAEEVVSSLEHTSGHHMRSIALSPGLVLGEARRLRQALANLVDNATKHTHDTGTVTITIERADSLVLISVEDDGPGVRPEDRERIFERFTRLQSGDSAPRGFGLGLYIVRAIVESHGGRIHVEDREQGPGARFVITLPAAPGI